MGKIILSAFMLMMVIDCYAQNTDTTGLNMPFKGGELIYEEVVPQENMAKAELYKNAKQWFVDAFKSSKDVIQMEDKDEGKIVGKGFTNAYYRFLSRTHTVRCMLSVQIECKDNRYRYRIYNMEITSEVVQSLPISRLSEKYGKKPVIGILASVDEQVRSLIASIKKSMASKSSDF